MPSRKTESKDNKGSKIGRMCAPALVKSIKSESFRFDVVAKRWPSMSAAFLILIVISSSCCCCSSVAASGGVAATMTTTTTTEVRYPCAFIDTINVTGTPFAYEQHEHSNASLSNNTNDSVNINSTLDSHINDEQEGDGNNTIAAFLHNLGITSIPRELIATYHFVIKDGVRVPVERHLRACICKLKPCIRYCCAEGRYYDQASKSCVSIVGDIFNGSQQSGAYALTGMDHHEVAVRWKNGSTSLVQTAQHFNVHVGVPCDRMRFMHRNNELVHWTLFENGTIAHRNVIFPNYYCYTPHQLNNVTWIWQPLACVPKKLPFVLDTKGWTYAICLILTVICMSIILFVYLFCKDLRNTFYGVAVKVYSICIIVGYSLMAHLTLTDPAKFSRLSCVNIPACVILYLVLSFYILSCISFNFYMHFHGIILSRVMFWIIFFPIAFIIAGWSIFTANKNYDGKHIFGGDTCWFDPRNWSIMVYFYAPIFIACVLCIFFYILTMIHLSEWRDSKMRKHSESLEENRFRSFWKFFSYTCVVFLVCITSFAINYYREEWTHINYAVCLFVAFHGFGGLYALIGQNQQVQNFLRRIEEDVSSDDDDMTESAVPMSGF